MTPEQFEKFADAVEQDPWPCKYGHTSCTDRRGGRCFDEEYQNTFGDTQDDEEDDE